MHYPLYIHPWQSTTKLRRSAYFLRFTECVHFILHKIWTNNLICNIFFLVLQIWNFALNFVNNWWRYKIPPHFAQAIIMFRWYIVFVQTGNEGYMNDSVLYLHLHVHLVSQLCLCIFFFQVSCDAGYKVIYDGYKDTLNKFNSCGLCLEYYGNIVVLNFCA